MPKGITFWSYMKSFTGSAHPKWCRCQVSLIAVNPFLQICDLVVLVMDLLGKHVDSMTLIFQVLAHLWNLTVRFGLCRGALQERGNCPG